MNFTELLRRALATGADEDRVRVMAELGRTIANRIRSAEMWDQPPEYLGCAEVAHWREAYPADFATRALDYATAAPTLDFFADRFTPALDRGGPLANALARGDDVGAYVAVMVVNFLTDRQKDHDPVGYRVFKNLEAVVQELAAGGALALSGLQERKGKLPRIRRTSVIRFAAPVGAPPATAVIELVLAADSLRGAVHKLSKKGVGAQRLLRPAVAALPGAGVEGFEFGDLLTPLQAAVREAARQWSEGASGAAVETTGPGGEKNATKNRITAGTDSYPTLDEHLCAIRREVRAEIDTGSFQQRTRGALCRVLDDWFAHLAETDADGDDHPPLDDWARRLGVKRSTLWDHLERLRGIVDRVLARTDRTGR